MHLLYGDFFALYKFNNQSKKSIKTIFFICVQNRCRMISQSRKVLLLLSKGYVTNGWCREEFDHACRHVQQHNEKDLVIVLLHDPNVHKAMDRLTSPAKSQFAVRIQGDVQRGNVGVQGELERRCLINVDGTKERKGIQDAAAFCVENGRVALGRAGGVAHVGEGDGNGEVAAAHGTVILNTHTTVHLQGAEPDHEGNHHAVDPAERRRRHEELTNSSVLYRKRVEQQGSKKPLSKKEAREAERLKELCRFRENGEELVLEPLCSYLLEGGFVELSDRLFKHKLLFELSRQRKEKRVADETE
jgi:hypothetical protein